MRERVTRNRVFRSEVQRYPGRTEDTHVGVNWHVLHKLTRYRLVDRDGGRETRRERRGGGRGGGQRGMETSNETTMLDAFIVR